MSASHEEDKDARFLIFFFEKTPKEKQKREKEKDKGFVINYGITAASFLRLLCKATDVGVESDRNASSKFKTDISPKLFIIEGAGNL